jgi:hypothetical protein
MMVVVAGTMPILAGVAVATSRNLITFVDEKGDARPSVSTAFWVSALTLALRTFLDIEIIDIGLFIVGVSLLSLGLASIAIVSARPSGKKINALLGSAFMLAVYFYGVIGQANQILDAANPAVHRVMVTGKSAGSGQHRSYDFDITAWGEQPAGQVSVTEPFYNRTAKGATICIYQYPGWMHIRWYDIADCPSGH